MPETETRPRPEVVRGPKMRLVAHRPVSILLLVLISTLAIRELCLEGHEKKVGLL